LTWLQSVVVVGREGGGEGWAEEGR
jgi:hypothetical protein